MEDWDLDLEVHRRHIERAIATGRRPPKLVHNLVFSMPGGTPPDILLKAVKVFAREKFALQHRYVMALHTDQRHPHVHVVVKAVSEEGARLNIRKATLREWRRDFAQYLRDLGIEANATERAVRGQCQTTKKDGIYRATLRRDSSHHRERAQSVARELAHGGLRPEPGAERLIATREAVARGWAAVTEVLGRQGLLELADATRRFLERMPPPRTDRQQIADHLRGRVRKERADQRSPMR